MQFLKADTSVKVVVGPFVDVGDGFTPETGITLGAADEAELLKHDNATTVDISGRTWAALTGVDGYYHLTVTTTDTETEGMLTVVVQDDDVCLPVKQEYMVLNAGMYELMCGTSGESENLRASAGGIVKGTAETGTLSTTQMTSDLTEATDDHYNGRIIVFLGGVLDGQATDITDYTGASGLLTFTAITEAPVNGQLFVIV